jgi:hypothetical protein
VVLSGLSVFVTSGDLPAGGIDEHVERLREGGSALDVMIADELEEFALRVNSSLVVNGAVAKMKSEAGRDTIVMTDLNQIASGESTTFQCPEDQEAMKRPLATTDWNGIGSQRLCGK